MLFGHHANTNPFHSEPIKPTSRPKRSTHNGVDAFISRYKDDPVGFVREILAADPLPWQCEFLEKVAAGTRRISVRAGVGVGKSTACAWVLIWYSLTRFPQKSICTAPNARLLDDVLFGDTKAWINKLPSGLKAEFDVKGDKITIRDAPNESFMSARVCAADRPEALRGIHSENVLLIVDEASGVADAAFEAAAGTMSGHNAQMILISNPTRNSGYFFKTQNEWAGEIWETMHVSCLDPAISRVVSSQQIKEAESGYGVESNFYRISILGEFATSDDDTLIPAGDVDSAMSRDITADPDERIVYGLDVARFGSDRSVLCKRRGPVVEEFRVWRNLDLMQLVGAVRHEAGNDRPYEICVDSIGLGAGVADRLRELGQNVRDVNVSECSAINPQAFKLRDELWISVRDWLRARACRLPEDKALREELVSPTFAFSSNGKLVVESKDKMKRRGMRSPDLADALCLTFASTAASIGGRATPWVRGEPIRRKLKSVV